MYVCYRTENSTCLALLSRIGFYKFALRSSLLTDKQRSYMQNGKRVWLRGITTLQYSIMTCPSKVSYGFFTFIVATLLLLLEVYLMPNEIVWSGFNVKLRITTSTNYSVGTHTLQPSGTPSNLLLSLPSLHHLASGPRSTQTLLPSPTFSTTISLL